MDNLRNAKLIKVLMYCDGILLGLYCVENGVLFFGGLHDIDSNGCDI